MKNADDVCAMPEYSLRANIDHIERDLPYNKKRPCIERQGQAVLDDGAHERIEPKRNESKLLAVTDEKGLWIIRLTATMALWANLTLS